MKSSIYSWIIIPKIKLSTITKKCKAGYVYQNPLKQLISRKSIFSVIPKLFKNAFGNVYLFEFQTVVC